MDRLSPDAFDWTLLRSFLAVLESGSVSAAARRGGAHQPTLSRHLAELENQLGVPLFERTGRGMRPTAVAQELGVAARRMQGASHEVARIVASHRDQTRGTVRITTSEVAACYLLPPVLAELQAREPGLSLELAVSNSVDNLLAREADIAVRMVRPTQGSLLARRLADLRLGACAHRDYLKRTGTPRAPEDLASHRLIGFDRDETILRGSARLGRPLTREDFALRSDNQLACTALLASGAGIGFAAEYVRRQLPGVQSLLPELGIPPMPCWLVVHREIRGNRLVRRVWDHLAEAIPRQLATLQ